MPLAPSPPIYPSHLLVGNPTAQSGRNAERIGQARRELERVGIPCELLPTEPHGATIGRVARALDEGTHRVVIAMGGDGTFREVAEGLLASRRHEEVALAMLPTGTANDQGRSFGLDAEPEDLPRNVAVIAEGAETRLDAGRMETFDERGQPIHRARFFDSAGWGISARVLRVRNEDRAVVEKLGPLKELYRDHLVYAGALARVFLESYVVDDKFSAHMTLDGAPFTLTGLTDLVVKNTRVYAGAWVFDRTAKHDDGIFEVVPFRGKRDWTSKAIVTLEESPLTEEMLNAVGIEHSKLRRATHIDIRFEVPAGRPLPAAQLDGEEATPAAHVRIDVERQALRLIVPAEFADPRGP